MPAKRISGFWGIFFRFYCLTLPLLLRLRLLMLGLIIIASGAAVAGPVQLTTTAVSAGQYHGLALRSDGTLWSFGTNIYGELGQGPISSSLFPNHVASLTNIISISAGSGESFAVQSNGVVWAWGYNTEGELGIGSNAQTNRPAQMTLVTNAIGIAAGGYHTLVLLSDRRVMACGYNGYGSLGDGTQQNTNRPVSTSGLTNVIAVAAGDFHSLALTSAGDVWSWGRNDEGELGRDGNALLPTKIPALSNVTQITAGSYHCFALTRSGQVYGWGFNGNGELGLGTTTDAHYPTFVTNLSQIKWISAALNGSSAISTNGTLYEWGVDGYQGVLLPRSVGPADAYVAVSFGYEFLLTTKTDGSVWVWGNNDYGQLGNGGGIPSVYELTTPTFSFSPYPWAQMIPYSRGDRAALNYNSFVLPLDFERSVKIDPTGSDLYAYGLATPWFLRTTKEQVQHVSQLTSGTTNITRFAVENPIVALGAQGGGSSLSVGQGYTVGAFAGAYDEGSGKTNILRVSVYDRASFAGTATNISATNVFYIALPRRFVASESNAWANFATNGFIQVVETNGLRTTVQFVDGPNDGKPWGLSWMTNSSGAPQIVTNVVLAGYKITHTANSTNYFYKVDGLGVAQVGTNTIAPMATTNNVGAYLPLYSLDFDSLPAWRANVIDRPYFEGIPLPPTYAGKTAAELNGLLATPTNTIWLTNNSAYTNLDTSPELRRHPQLDQFVQEMGRDPLALASYVINEIDLTDPVAAADKSKVVADSINPGGINRGALGVFLEKQGSPIEQCALLVYLLRQAGYPATYVFPTNNNLRLLDSRVSQLWQVQVKGVSYARGIPTITNSLIVANYPWVVANIGTNCVHIFPWLKDTEIVQGFDLYDYMPTNYSTAYNWVKDYCLSSSNIMTLDPELNLPLSLWPKFVDQTVRSNALSASLSLDDFGVRAFNRRHQFPTWSSLPQPNLLTNQTQVATPATLSDSAVTYPFLTNIFDLARVQVFKTDFSSGNKIFDTGDWYACDWNDRKFLLFTNAANSLKLWLAAYRPGITSTSSFAGPSSINVQSTNFTLGVSDNALKVRMTHQRRVATLTSPYVYFPVSEFTYATNDQPCNKGDMVSLCFTHGRVTPNMVRLHADGYWRLQQQRATNTAFIPAVEDYQGAAATVLGMSYLERESRWEDLLQHLHGTRVLSHFFSGLAMLELSVSTTQMQAQVSFVDKADLVGNGTLRPDSGENFATAIENYRVLVIAGGSAEEHDVVNSVFPEKEAVSTVRLLQLAAERSRSFGWAAPIELNSRNYKQAGSQTYTGYGSTALQSQDSSIWQAVTNAFQTWDGEYVRVLITPGLVTNNTGSYKGVGALILSKNQQAAFISGNFATLNGGWGSLHPTMYFDTTWGKPVLRYDTMQRFNESVWFRDNTGNDPVPQSFLSPLDTLTGTDSSFAWSPQQQEARFETAATLLLPGGIGTIDTMRAAENQGFFGLPEWVSSAFDKAVDPVNVVSGEFYINTADLSLPGPFPLELRRNYVSRNTGDNQFGFGWKMNFMPFLVVATNASNDEVIYGAELDGSVITYRKQSTNTWIVTADDNPSLNNQSVQGIGSVANAFNLRLERSTTNATTFIIKGPDGSRRYYDQMTFRMSGSSNVIDRTRPYLARAEDHRGNYHRFFYGTDTTANDYGQLNRIESANGNFFEFHYDVAGRILDAFTGDGRHVVYDYDDYGDLVQVTLPDFSSIQYEYQHISFTTTNGSTGKTNFDSNHRLSREVKRDGEILQNAYDSLGRVTNQAATVGADLRLITNAVFLYSNNFTNLTNLVISGTTTILDYAGRTNSFYRYTNNLITQITDAVGRTNTQDWFEAGETNKTGYYQRSLEASVDRRGLIAQYRYDGRGNATNVILTGDLTGHGNTNQSATTILTYTTNDLPATITDPVGNVVTSYYEDGSFRYMPTRVVRSNGGVGISTNYYFYTNVTDSLDMGGWFKTNSAYGLRIREVRADAATNEWAFNGRGFVKQETRRARTGDDASNNDPAVTNTISYNARGQIYERQDAAGGRTRFDFDAMGRMKWKEVIDESGAALSREYFYYNRRGQVEWYKGPRANPDNFIRYEYDGAGRRIQEVHWRSRANRNGSGVESETGDDLYAATLTEYDPLGNPTRQIDPRGASVTNSYDAASQLIGRKALGNDGSVLGTKGFAYEPGGEVAYETNILAGLTSKQYTSAGKLKLQSNPDGSSESWRYYLDGRPSTNTLRNGAYTRFVYDDANRTVQRIFYSSGETALATNTSVMDGRGNAVKTVDAIGNVWTNVYDGLDRIKVAAAPPVVSIITNEITLGSITCPCTNIGQQITKSFYDAAGRVLTSSNALGEKIVTTSDALGRPVRVEVFSSSGASVRLTQTSYSADHQSHVVTEGSGANAMTSLHFTDNDNNPVLDLRYPASGLVEYTVQAYDVGGGRTESRQCSYGNGITTIWRTNSWQRDAFGRVVLEVFRDGASNSYRLDAAGSITNWIVASGVKTVFDYDSAGRLVDQYDVGGSTIARGTTNTYYASNEAFPGMLKSRKDGRGVECVYQYDDWLRTATETHAGPLSEQNLITTWSYDIRGLWTTNSQVFTNSATGPSSKIIRMYDADRLVVNESTFVGTQRVSLVSQAWDSAGRRTQLGCGEYGAGFGYRADGMIASLSGGHGNGAFSYTDAGLLTSRALWTSAGAWTNTISARDGVGRILSAATTVTLPEFQNPLSETLTWTGDGLLATHKMVRNDSYFNFDGTDDRAYFYDPLTRRLIEERLNLDATRRWTNIYNYDGGAVAGPGVLTKVGQTASSNSWSAGSDALLRLAQETNVVARRSASGYVNGRSTVKAFLDSRPMPVSQAGTQWNATLELSGGAHFLLARAIHPSTYTVEATRWFTNKISGDRISSTYDALGNVTQLIWTNSSGTSRVQTLTWDGRGRLLKVSERDSAQNGYDWSATYDGLDRRLRTVTSNTVASTSGRKIIDQIFDPQFEFLEIGVREDGQATWKVYGPDLNGRYGGLNGIGGFEAIVPAVDLFCPIVSDAQGNLLAVYDPRHTNMMWNASRVMGYGAAPSYRPVAFGQGASLVEASAWRGKWADIHGRIWLGKRYLNWDTGRFSSADPAGRGGSEDLYSLGHGDPINYVDPDGRLTKQYIGANFDVATTLFAGLMTPAVPGTFPGITPLTPMERYMQNGLSQIAQNAIGHPMQDLGFYQGNSFASDARDWVSEAAAAYFLERALRGAINMPLTLPVPETQWGAPLDPYTSAASETRPSTDNALAVSGRQWYDYFAQKYGGENVDWVSGSGRTITWPPQLPVPTADRMFRIAPEERSPTFVNELTSVEGARPPDAIAHHIQFLQLNGLDNGAANGTWVPVDLHTAGHAYTTPIINSVPYGVEIVIKPNP